MTYDEQWNERCPGLASGGVSFPDWRAVTLCRRELFPGSRGVYGCVGGSDPGRGSADGPGDLVQKWTGQFWSGQWEHQMYLALPTARPGKPGTGEGVEVEEEEEPAEAAPVKAKKKS